MGSKNFAREIVVLLFGVVVPFFMLAQAYVGLSSLSNNVNYHQTTDNLVVSFEKAKKSLSNGNDYALFALLYTEHANQKTMINKQVMKISVMQLGFAVVSLGMMLILLGFNDGGATANASISEIKFDFKSGSSGIVVFVIGALMATAGGVLKNDYGTVPIPDFLYTQQSNEISRSVSAYTECKKLGEARLLDCVVGVFEQLNQDALK